MEAGTRIHLCGPLRIHLAGQPREGLLHGRQGRLLFAFLVFRRHRPVTRDALVQALWGEEGMPPSEGALAPVLSRLRRAVAPATVDGRDGIHLSLPQPAYIDVEAAEAALRRARSSPGAEERLAGAQEAATIVAAGLLPGLEAPWLEHERAGLARLRTEALELGAEAAMSIEPPLAESLARAAVAGAPFRESAWAALIAALRARGNVAEALQVYDEVRRLLRDELGTVPGRQLLALHRALLAESDERPSVPLAAPHPRRLQSAADLVERDDELRAIDAALDRLVAGEGGLVLFEGTAGIGKTRLLEELRHRAAARDVCVLVARAALLEREFAFGVVRQLLEEVASPSLLEGPAAAAGVVLSDAGTTEGTFPILNGLYRLVERLASTRPLVLCVDDLQWSDPASLRFIAYLARRIAQLPLLLATTVRTGEPDADEALLGELAQEPVTVALTPRPLSLQATAALLRHRFAEHPDGAFTAACHEVTAGNPLLLRQLLGAVAAEGITPGASEDLERCRRVGAAWVIGRGLRILAEFEGPNRLEVAREAVTRLSETSARLELTKAKMAWAGALAATGQTEPARREWNAAAQLAHRCGAAGLARHAAQAAHRAKVAAAPRIRR